MSGTWIGQTAVTQAQFVAVMGKNPSQFRDPDLPVTGISWDEAIAFGHRLSMMTGTEIRPPTLEEWIHAESLGHAEREELIYSEDAATLLRAGKDITSNAVEYTWVAYGDDTQPRWRSIRTSAASGEATLRVVAIRPGNSGDSASGATVMARPVAAITGSEARHGFDPLQGPYTLAAPGRMEATVVIEKVYGRPQLNFRLESRDPWVRFFRLYIDGVHVHGRLVRFADHATLDVSSQMVTPGRHRILYELQTAYTEPWRLSSWLVGVDGTAVAVSE